MPPSCVNRVPWKQEEAPTFILTTVLLSCQCPCFSLRSRSRRAWELRDRPSRQGKRKQGSRNPCVALWCCQTSFDPCIPQRPHPPCNSPCPVITPALAIICRGGRIGLSPLVSTYLDVEIIISELSFHIYLLTFISPTVSLKYVCPFTVITNEVILNKLE